MAADRRAGLGIPGTGLSRRACRLRQQRRAAAAHRLRPGKTVPAASWWSAAAMGTPIVSVAEAGDGLLAALENMLPDPLVRVSGSTQVDVSPRRLGGKLMIHLVNTAGRTPMRPRVESPRCRRSARSRSPCGWPGRAQVGDVPAGRHAAGGFMVRSARGGRVAQAGVVLDLPWNSERKAGRRAYNGSMAGQLQDKRAADRFDRGGSNHAISRRQERRCGAGLADGFLPEGAEVRVELVRPSQSPLLDEQGQTLGQKLMKYAGRAVNLPEDAALNHDHYLHGTPKR